MFKTIKSRMLLSFFIIIFLLGISQAFLVYWVIEKDIIARAQEEVKISIKTAWSIYSNRDFRILATNFQLISYKDNPSKFKDVMELDYLYVIEADSVESLKSDIAKKSFQDRKGTGGTRIIAKDELIEMDNGYYDKSKIEIKDTPKARSDNRKILEDAMAIEYAIPVFDKAGNIKRIIYGGKIINNNFTVVDWIRNLVFEDKFYKGKPVGTVTVFQDDVRISTNVLDEKGDRAVGTIVSEEVYENVVVKGKPWVARAFVVNDWYLTAYEPIKDINGRVIGILYIGSLEQPFRDMTRNIFFNFLITIVFIVLLSTVLAFILTESIIRPVNALSVAIGRLSGGDFNCRAGTETSLVELNELAKAFNEMAERIVSKRKRLEVANSKLTDKTKDLEEANIKLMELNKSYMDLIGFVAHELKGILASTILNAYTVRDGFLGMVNFKQRKALDSITRNLDYLAATVKNFLNLSRIEKGEMNLHKSEIFLREDIFLVSQEAFDKPAEDKNMKIINNIAGELKVNADHDLLLIVANNLLGNAVKYGDEGGEIRVNAKKLENFIELEVYNDGNPISDEQKEKLFKKFSRLHTKGKKKIRGTGLGLFVTKQIIEQHGGEIWVEAKEKGNSFKFKVSC